MTDDPDEFEKEQSELIAVTFVGGALDRWQTQMPLHKCYHRDRKSDDEYVRETVAPDGNLVSRFVLKSKPAPADYPRAMPYP